MKKTFKIFRRDFNDIFSTIGLVEASIFRTKNEFPSMQECEKFLIEHPHLFAENDELVILPVFTKSIRNEMVKQPYLQD